MKKICVFPNDPVSAYVAKGEIKTRYFNPCEMFDEVHVMSLADHDCEPRAAQEVAGRARLLIHPIGRMSPRTIGGLGQVRRSLLKTLEAINPDVIRAYNPLFAGWLAVSCARRLRKPSVVSIHGNYDRDVRRLFLIEGRLFRFAKYVLFCLTTEPYVLRHADKVICAYEFPVDYVKHHGARDVSVIYNRVDVERFKPVSRSGRSDSIHILTVGRLDREKNHACLIRALEGTNGLHLRIIGDGEEYSALTALARRLNVSNRVEFRRQIPHRNIHCEYEKADVFAIATRYGGVHIPVLEAMAAGLPIVVPQPRWEDAPELAADVAQVVENRPLAFRTAFLRLRDDPSLRQRLGALARVRIMPFRGDVMEARERQVYEQVLAQSTSATGAAPRALSRM